ncbi:MAG: hypothetical protein R3B45_01730 [Bdellovibrionota bacterium]
MNTKNKSNSELDANLSQGKLQDNSNDQKNTMVSSFEEMFRFAQDLVQKERISLRENSSSRAAKISSLSSLNQGKSLMRIKSVDSSKENKENDATVISITAALSEQKKKPKSGGH